jgi:uncharacterized circularly permuted ATP-grasp superfamily protein
MKRFRTYQHQGLYDEMFDQNLVVRSPYAMFLEKLSGIPAKKLRQLQSATDRAQMLMGMTFNVYGDDQGMERILKLDIIPRIVSASDWEILERGLHQRIQALNLFIDDLYHDRKIIGDGVIPAEIIDSCPAYLDACKGLDPPKGIWCHITGTDIVRHSDGHFYVLEDNLRCPSGVSYMLENREILKRTFPGEFNALKIRPVYDYPFKLLDMLEHLSDGTPPQVAVLTPGIYNSAYFEHSYLALQMGIELVEGRDLVVKDGWVYMYTTRGLKKVDVIYRRIDDVYMDPLVFQSDSMLGVPGLFEAYRKGRVALANAPGTGVADDKAVYAYVPDVIRYYLGEDPILSNVPTYICDRPGDLNYVLEHIPELVVKETNAAGGYGMLIGPSASKDELALFRDKIRSNPRNYIAQPTLSLSTVPSIIDDRIEPRHVDLRPYVLYGEKIEVIPGALSRVALRKGSLVVNSSQGGGSKDTWVINN